jgi:hypothetical protein
MLCSTHLTAWPQSSQAEENLHLVVSYERASTMTWRYERRIGMSTHH